MEPRPGDVVAPAATAAIATDAVVIGAGPVGLFQVFELGLLDIRAHVIDALPHIGGQPVELYPDKPIYDIPGLPFCTGQGLADALLRQSAPFAPQFHLGQTVNQVHAQEDGQWLVGTSTGTQFLSKTVFIAAGVGAFEPRRIKLAGIEAHEGTQLRYHLGAPSAFAGQDVLIQGDSDTAIEAALSLSATGPHRANSVTLVHRRDSFKAEPERVALMRERCAAGAMRFIAGQITGHDTQDGRLRAVHLTRPDGNEQAVPLDTMLVLQGLSPQLGPLTDWGLAMERKQLVVNTETFSTSAPGIFAVGDINTYPGKRKLLVCGFHECTLAAYGAAPIVHPTRPVLLQYTTTSTHLHQVLGVGHGTGDKSRDKS
ncbi:NAD(P)/FAD-dependent oxidoreductase [Hydrogenophaga sp.]|uniref:NAD(P)/FAD-dependent oxidoreductase n=1 Tax=Hydrogenophaga sp. TaxID=1904254 RepID=UPI00286E60AB|nr:NAD(P)/FAD-dependent oxidoreductase [Hydrogenophaga sp.]